MDNSNEDYRDALYYEEERFVKESEENSLDFYYNNDYTQKQGE